MTTRAHHPPASLRLIRNAMDLGQDAIGGCPGDHDLGSYLDRLMPRPERDRFEEHIVACPACRKRLVALFRLMKDATSLAPSELIAMSRDLFPAQPESTESAVGT